MYNEIQWFPRHTKTPLFAVASASSGTLSASSPGTYTLTDAQGNTLASGSVDATSSLDALTVQEWKTVDGDHADGNDLVLTPGNYGVEFLLNLEDSNGVARVRSFSIILVVPGSRTYPHYPTGIDLQVFLASAGMLDNPPAGNALFLDLDGACASAVSTWERLTGWHPFLADPGADPTPRVFDPPGSSPHWRYGGGGWELDLGGGAISVASVAQNQHDYIIGTDSAQVYLLPADAAERGRPYDALRFAWPVYGVLQSLIVTAKWGFADTLPEDVWTLLLQMAAQELLPHLSLLKTGGLVEVRQENLTRKYAAHNAFGPFDGQAKQWAANLKSKAFHYKRKKIV